MGIRRRDFVRITGLGAGTAALSGMPGCIAGGEEAGRARAGLAHTGPPLPDRFPASMVRASREELDLPLRVISGRVPSDVYGHAFIVSSVPDGDGSPVPNGDGMMYRVDFGGTRVELKSRLAKTPAHRT